MRNKVKIAAIVIALIAGMVLYKSHFEKKAEEDSDRKESRRASPKPKYDVN